MFEPMLPNLGKGSQFYCSQMFEPMLPNLGNILGTVPTEPMLPNLGTAF